MRSNGLSRWTPYTRPEMFRPYEVDEVKAIGSSRKADGGTVWSLRMPAGYRYVMVVAGLLGDDPTTPRLVVSADLVSWRLGFGFVADGVSYDAREVCDRAAHPEDWYSDRWPDALG